MFRGSLILVALLLNFSFAEAQVPDGKLCYILDGILVIYGVILTILYCRLRIHPIYINNGGSPQGTGGYPQKGEGLYAGLTHKGQDTYETIKVQKKAMLV
ncbi:high affinity immunoglobulin epsilon receptor subunit gamma isoform X3 [Salmo salar]|uniref:high affinity immunoglobulin epsilon receptor subunit gamma isoform X3 n=1 Tax=Salmo salar TaxID=8030 RepID=UPI000181FB76|nr:Fc receptor, IgE, high affinity I, gamma polypeptide like isoform X3 [Salmo salar]ACI69533.1 High affinity immunoglobulin epsilon receptor subunit gamma precursor [Salmo salar]|eukprot:XP_013996246.1 PREDICTED: high affinity immunoglobulin epsilon receptor subunit gamma-like isoform X3 [Salmo salar]